MKIKFNSKYNTVSAYVVLTFTACLLVVIMMFKFAVVKYYISKLMKISAPIIWGFVLAYILNPLMKLFERVLAKVICRKKERPRLLRTLSIFLVMLCFFALIFAAIKSIVPEILNNLRNISGNSQTYFDRSQAYLEEKVRNMSPGIQSFIHEQLDNFEQLLTDSTSAFTPRLDGLFSKGGILANITGSAISLAVSLLNFFIGVIVSVSLLSSKEKFIAQGKKVVKAIFKPSRAEKFMKIAHDANNKFMMFLVGRGIESIIVGIMCFILMKAMNIPYPMLVSVIGALTNMIPFFGGFIGAGIGAVLILLSAPQSFVKFLIMFILLQQFASNVVGPKIIGDKIGLNPFWVLFSVFIGGGLFGFVGMLLSVPVFAVIYPLIKDWVNKRVEKRSKQHIPIAESADRIDSGGEP